MKIVTVLGTRPEIIRLSLIIKKLDSYSCHIVIHTGQNYDTNLHDIFMQELGVRKPDYYLDAKGSFAEQVAIILKKTEVILQKEKPDKFLVLGDTNSSLAAIIAKRLQIPVYHMEAGNRCFDDTVPEEINRRIIDHASDILLPYTQKSKENLLQEGIKGNRIFVTGNPILEVLNYFEKNIRKSNILEKIKIKKNNYFLVTLHRQENVDNPVRLTRFIDALNKISKNYTLPIIWSVHPRTKKMLEEKKYKIHKKVLLFKPFGLFDFIKLEKNAKCVLTDSGTVQEECSILHIPNVTLRDTTERPETLEVGSNIISGSEPESILKALAISMVKKSQWSPPIEYLQTNVSDVIVNILHSHYLP